MQHFFLVLFASFFLGAAAHAETVIKFSHVVDENTPKGQAANYFAALVNDRLEGEIRVEVYPDGTLFSDVDAIKAVQKNTDDFGIIIAPSLSKLQQFSPTLKIFDLPGLFTSQNDIDKLTNSPVAKNIVKQLKQHGFLPIAFWHNGMRMFSVRLDGDVNNPAAALNGKTIRTENSEVQTAFLQSIGANPKVVAFTDLTDALVSQSVDGQSNTWSNIYTQNIHNYQDYIFEPGFTYLSYLVLINEEFWNGLHPLTQRQLQWAMGEATYMERKIAIEINEQQRQKIIADNAAQVVTLSADQQEQWLRNAPEIEARFKDEIGPEILQEVHDLLGH